MKEDRLIKYQLPLGLRCDNMKETKNSLHGKETSFNPKIDMIFHNFVFGHRIVIDTVNNKTQKGKTISKEKERNPANKKKSKKSKKTKKNKENP